MKKLTALLCTAAMTLGMATSAFANPSISTVATENVTVSAETAAIIPEGKTLEVREADPAGYANSAVAEAVTKLNDAAQTVTVADILTLLNVDTTAEIKSVSGTVIDPTVYEPLTKFADLVITDGVSVEYDINGEVAAVKLTITLEAVKDAVAENLLIMQMDPTTGEVYFIEIDEEDFNPETGEITVTFPCLGPFTVLEK